jgi:hypothetical protein
MLREVIGDSAPSRAAKSHIINRDAVCGVLFGNRKLGLAVAPPSLITIANTSWSLIFRHFRNAGENRRPAGARLVPANVRTPEGDHTARVQKKFRASNQVLWRRIYEGLA